MRVLIEDGQIIAFDETGDAIRDAAFVKEVDTATGEWKFVAIQGVN